MSLPQAHLRAAYVALTAGAIGGLVRALLPALVSRVGIYHLLHLHTRDHGHYYATTLYTFVFWYAIAGLLFLFDGHLFRQTRRDWVRALIYGLIAALVEIFIVAPFVTHTGVGGRHLGIAAPFLALIYNTIGWSFPAYAAFKAAGLQRGDGGQGLLSSEPLLA